jgi:hypothetical protein
MGHPLTTGLPAKKHRLRHATDRLRNRPPQFALISYVALPTGHLPGSEIVRWG